MEGYQRREATQVHALHGELLPDPHRSQFTGWIKPGSYYHGVVARKGQLHMCLHLVGTEPPKGPQIHPSQTHSVTQKKEETPTTSSYAGQRG